MTLLDVLIAVLLVGIIATGLLAAMGDYSRRAREAQTEANIRAVEIASQRYELVHSVPLGYVVDTSTDTLYDTFGADGRGFWMHLVNPTDVNGNVLGAPIDPDARSFVYGPYLAPAARPASLLHLGASPGALAAGSGGPAEDAQPVVTGTSGNATLAVTPFIAETDSDVGIARATQWRRGDGKEILAGFCGMGLLDRVRSLGAAAAATGSVLVVARSAALVEATSRDGRTLYRLTGYQDARRSLKCLPAERFERFLDHLEREPSATLADEEVRTRFRDESSFLEQLARGCDCLDLEEATGATPSPGYAAFAYAPPAAAAGR